MPPVKACSASPPNSTPARSVGRGAALRTRLVAAEAELAALAATGSSLPARAVPSAYKIGEIVVEEKDDGIYAQMDIGPVPQEAHCTPVAKVAQKQKVSERARHDRPNAVRSPLGCPAR
jgi:hypothetical protein